MRNITIYYINGTYINIRPDDVKTIEIYNDENPPSGVHVFVFKYEEIERLVQSTYSMAKFMVDWIVPQKIKHGDE